MKWNVGSKIAAAFGLLLTLFLIVGALSYQSTGALVDAANSRKHTYEVLREITELRYLLTDAAARQRSYVITGDEGQLEPYRMTVQAIAPLVRAIRTRTAENPRQQQRLDVLEPLIRDRLAFTQIAIELRRNQGVEAASAHIQSAKGQGLIEQIQKILADSEREEEGLLKKRNEVAAADAAAAKWTIVLGTLAALVLAIVSVVLLTRNVAVPLQHLTAVAERVTLGDLSVNVPPTDRSDEVGVLSRAFDRMTLALRVLATSAEQIAAGDMRATAKPQSPNDVLGNAFARMTENLREQIRTLSEGAHALGSASSEIVAATSQLAASASESAAAVSETTTTVEEVRHTAEVSSQKAKLVSDSAQKAALASQSGRKSTEDVGVAMGRISRQMESIAASMVRLSEQSEAIGQIMASVEDLAAQSNLLAVNAAIEAAKEGEHGKGFGVVAQEVKSLAEQSRQATTQVRTILGDIQKATTTAVMASEEGSKAVEAGTLQSEGASNSIQALTSSVNEAAQAAMQIAASSQQQLVGVDQVAGAMESIRQASIQNVASARQLEAAARDLNELGQRLRQLVERYQV